MARLAQFQTLPPPQGDSLLCGAASVVCAGAYLGADACVATTTAAALAVLVEQSGVDFTGGAGAPRLVELARHLGLGAEGCRYALRETGNDIAAAVRDGLPVLIQWRPWRMGLKRVHGTRNHWALVVEWPDDDDGPVALTDSYIAGGARSDLRSGWKLGEWRSRGGFSRAPSTVWISRR